MRAAARAILDDAEQDADLDRINALEMPYDPASEAVPVAWTPEHLGKRMVEAFVALARLPSARGPRRPGNHWPPYVYEWADRLAQEEQDAQEKMRRTRARNAVVIVPSGEDIRRMDLMLAWLSDLAVTAPDMARILQRWARLRSLPGRSIKEECRRSGLSHRSFYRMKDKAIDVLLARVVTKPVW